MSRCAMGGFRDCWAHSVLNKDGEISNALCYMGLFVFFCVVHVIIIDLFIFGKRCATPSVLPLPERHSLGTMPFLGHCFE